MSPPPSPPRPDPFGDPPDGDPTPTVDLHGLRPEDAQRRLEQALHAARVRGAEELLVITGRGWSNAQQKPVLRERMAAWLRSPAGRSRGARDVQLAAKGGALRVRLG